MLTQLNQVAQRLMILQLIIGQINQHIAEQLAELFNGKGWTKGLYPYRKLTTAEGWMSRMEHKMISFVAVAAGEIAGHAALIDHGWYWEAGRLAVSRHHQGYGIGRKLLNARIKYATDNGIKWFVIGCSYYQAISEINCLKRGMVPLGVVPNTYTELGMTWGEVIYLWTAEGYRIELDASDFSQALIDHYPDKFYRGNRLIPQKNSGKVCVLMPGEKEWEFVKKTELPPVIIDNPTGEIVAGQSKIKTTETTRCLLESWGW